MSTPTIIYLALWWYGIGVFGFCFWFTRNHKIDFFMMFCAGFFGLASWFMGYKIHGIKLGYNIWGVKVK